MKATIRKWPKDGTSFEATLRTTDYGKLSWPKSGFSIKVPTPYLVKINGRWRRIYVCQIGNAGTAYIGKPGKWEYIVDDVDLSEPTA
jgi:hypothetical protein